MISKYSINICWIYFWERTGFGNWLDINGEREREVSNKKKTNFQNLRCEKRVVHLSISVPHCILVSCSPKYLLYVLVTQLCLTLWFHGLSPTRLLCPWNSPGKNTGIGCHALLQGIFPTQGSSPGLLHCGQILSCLSYLGSPKIISHSSSTLLLLFSLQSFVSIYVLPIFLLYFPSLARKLTWDFSSQLFHNYG